VDDPAHVGLVDAHSERDRCDDDLCIVADERFLITAPCLRFEPRVIGQGAHAIRCSCAVELIDPLAREAIDDAGAIGVACAAEQFVVSAFRLRAHGVVEIGSIEARDMDARLMQCELPDDVLSHALRRGRRESGDGHAREEFAYAIELAVFGPEIVAPFGNTMGFIDHDRGDPVGGRDA